MLVAASRTNIYSSNSEDDVSEDDEQSRKRLLKAKKLDSDKVISLARPVFYQIRPFAQHRNLHMFSIELCITVCASRPIQCMFADLLIVFECVFSRTELQ